MDVGRDVEGDPDRISASVAVGQYRLEVGSPVGISISLVPPQPDAASREQAALSRAVADRRSDRKKRAGAVEAVDKASEDADQVTDQVERGVKLWTAVAAGRLDVGAINSELDSLLMLLQKLDRAGRFEEQLRLARALSRLLAVALRWLELLRSLREVLSAAERHGDSEARAWALHELGTLHLAAGQHARAEQLLGDARDLRAELGDKRALAATDRNLQVLCRVLRQLMRDGQLRERGHLRQLLRAHVILVVAILALMLGGGTAAIAALGGGGSVAGSTANSPSESGATTPVGGSTANSPAGGGAAHSVSHGGGTPASGGSPGNGPVDGGTTSQRSQTSKTAVSAVSPASGPASGGTRVTINGTGLASVSAVRFGNQDAADVTIVNDVTVNAVSPPGSGTVDVTVITPAGQSSPTTVDEFTYAAPSTVNGNPAGGSNSGISGIVQRARSAAPPTTRTASPPAPAPIK